MSSRRKFLGGAAVVAVPGVITREAELPFAAIEDALVYLRRGV